MITYGSAVVPAPESVTPVPVSASAVHKPSVSTPDTSQASPTSHQSAQLWSIISRRRTKSRLMARLRRKRLEREQLLHADTLSVVHARCCQTISGGTSCTCDFFAIGAHASRTQPRCAACTLSLAECSRTTVPYRPRGQHVAHATASTQTHPIFASTHNISETNREPKKNNTFTPTPDIQSISKTNFGHRNCFEPKLLISKCFSAGSPRA